MSLTLHILNGDATLKPFKGVLLEGDVLIWREILCEGPAITDLTDKSFWQQRRSFLQERFPIVPEGLHEDLEEQFLQLDLGAYTEVTLWFEYDLFCHVNFVALMSWLYSKNYKGKVAMICAGEIEGKEGRLYGLGELAPADLNSLHIQRTKLDASALAFAHGLWKLYCKADHFQLLPYIQAYAGTEFRYMEEAFKCHEQRFPGANGLCEIETRLLQTIRQGGHSRRKVIGTQLRDQGYYGFGDLQYETYLDGLAPLWQENEAVLELTEMGSAVLEGQQYERQGAQFGGAVIPAETVYLFKSERLGFREWQLRDVKPFTELNADPEVMEFFPSILTEKETREGINNFNRFFETHGYILYAVDQLSDGQFIGFIGFWHPSFEAEFTPFIEIGWRLRKTFWNKGYATEGATACLEYGFSTLDFEEVYSLTSVINVRSEKVMQKIGMEKNRTFDHPKIEEGHKLRPHVLYRVEKK